MLNAGAGAMIRSAGVIPTALPPIRRGGRSACWDGH
jgi:hypothetical protein